MRLSHLATPSSLSNSRMPEFIENPSYALESLDINDFLGAVSEVEKKKPARSGL
jgi:hypothetical protein